MAGSVAFTMVSCAQNVLEAQTAHLTSSASTSLILLYEFLCSLALLVPGFSFVWYHSEAAHSVIDREKQQLYCCSF